MKVTAIKSSRPNATTVHMGENIGWSSTPFCPAMATGSRTFPQEDGIVNCRACIKKANELYLDVEHLIQISSRVRNLIKAVREHAVANYGTGAWDVVVEAYSDSELAETVGKCRTGAGAIAKVAKLIGHYAARRAEHDAEIQAATEPPTPAEPQEYDRFAAGSHPDGSVVRATHTHDGELVAVTRTWPGRVGWGEIEVGYYEGEPAEFYHPGWRGVTVDSPNLCDHSAAPGEVCWNTACDRPQCCPF